MIVVNLIGVCLFFSYVITFFVFTTNKKLLFRQITVVVLVLITVLFYARHDPDDQQEIARVLGWYWFSGTGPVEIKLQSFS